MQYHGLFWTGLLGTILIVALLFGGKARASQTQPVSQTVSRVASANTKFGFKMLAELNRSRKAENVLFSPSSIAWCLTMALNGAGGKTKDEMMQALETKGFSLQDLNSAYAEWKNTSASIDPKVEIDIANSIWARRGNVIRPEFIETNKKFFGAEVSELDFNDPRALTTINSWVKDKTRSKIDRIVEEISPDSVLFLINAIYFNGKWTRAFDATKTKEEDFTIGNGTQKRLPMMHQRGTYQYLETPEFQSIRLPYGNERLSMYVFLPSKTAGLQSLHGMLTAANWEKWMTQYSESEGEIVLPKFRIEYEATLNKMLIALGMRSAFDPQQADFSAMIRNSAKAYISSVKHKAFAEVNEQGTEAAAVTSTEIRVTSAVIPRKTFQMIVNRPFFFVIRDSASGALLFMGSVVAP